MTDNELEHIQRDIADLRKAVKKSNPFLREVVEIRGYATWSVILGCGILAYCLVSHFLLLGGSGGPGLPQWWALLSWLLLALFFAAGAVIKWLIIDRRAREVEKGAGFGTALRALYCGEWGQLNLPIALGMLVGAAFAVWIGHPWYIVGETAFFLGLACASIVLAVDAREYLATGWYATLSSLASLFFVERAPFLWLAIVWAGIFLVYGISGLARGARPRKPEAGEPSGGAER